MNDKQLDIFLTAAECLSFSKAEKKLYLSRQTIMKQIEHLEEELGFLLFVRSPSGISLTRAGAQFQEGILPMRSQFQALLVSCRRADELPTQLRIEIPRHPFSILDHAITQFSRQYPEIKLEITRSTSKGRIDRMRAGQIDIADMPYRDSYDLTGLTYTPLIDSPYYCMLTYSHPLAQKKTIHADDLCGKVIYVHSLPARKPLIDTLSRSHPDITFKEITGDEIEAILNICYNGGIYITPAHFATKLNQLIALPLDCPITQKIGLLYRSEHNKAVERFVQIALDKT